MTNKQFDPKNKQEVIDFLNSEFSGIKVEDLTFWKTGSTIPSISVKDNPWNFCWIHSMTSVLSDSTVIPLTETILS